MARPLSAIKVLSYLTVASNNSVVGYFEHTPMRVLCITMCSEFKDKLRNVLVIKRERM